MVLVMMGRQKQELRMRWWGKNVKLRALTTRNRVSGGPSAVP